MKTGSKWELFVPADLAYGKRRFGRVAPDSTLVFDIELLSIAKGDPIQTELKLQTDKEKEVER
jgi:hypothetical protein